MAGYPDDAADALRCIVPKRLDDAERVLLSAATSVGASKFWYCRGAELTALERPRYAGCRKENGELIQDTLLDPRYQNQRVFLPPPMEWTHRNETQFLAIRVKDKRGETLGFAVFERNQDRAFGESEAFTDTEREIASYIIRHFAHYLEPQRLPHRPLTDVTGKESVGARVQFLEGLADLFLQRLREHSTAHREFLRKHKKPLNRPSEQEWHVRRMAELVVDLACEINKSSHIPLEISGEKLRALRALAILHDAGKGQVPVSILEDMDLQKKEGDPAWEMLKAHAFDGRDILDLPGLNAWAVMTSSHHMTPAGLNYPYCVHASGRQSRLSTPYLKKNGDKVPLSFEARLFQLCDSFEAMTGDRRYQKGVMRSKEGGVAASSALEKLFFDVLHEHGHYFVDPLLFQFLAGSQTLQRYVDTQLHIDKSDAEKDRLRDMAQAIAEFPALIRAALKHDVKLPPEEKAKLDKLTVCKAKEFLSPDNLHNLIDQHGLQAPTLLFTPARLRLERPAPEAEPEGIRSHLKHAARRPAAQPSVVRS